MVGRLSGGRRLSCALDRRFAFPFALTLALDVFRPPHIGHQSSRTSCTIRFRSSPRHPSSVRACRGTPFATTRATPRGSNARRYAGVSPTVIVVRTISNTVAKYRLGCECGTIPAVRHYVCGRPSSPPPRARSARVMARSVVFPDCAFFCLHAAIAIPASP